MDVCFPGSSAVTGPGAVKGRERGSLTVWYRYDPGYETHKKYWCRGADWGSCNTLVRTTGSEQEVKKGRVSIRDDQRYRTFSVTMEALTLGDADTYWCGVERTGADLHAQVTVTVDPAPVSPEDDNGPPNVTTSSSLLGSVYFLLLVFLKVPLLLGMLSAVLWVHRPQRRPGGGRILERQSRIRVHRAWSAHTLRGIGAAFLPYLTWQEGPHPAAALGILKLTSLTAKTSLYVHEGLLEST
ncbi:CMRF35-like molecule 5 [Talpa occidentalis]|uniref:CMRF35-like molecule 5 n=1 Tax=Talpa occidentalis TaxID=50954 RepID=UPI0023F8626A|nr:CMRF35-like molecule 5 [Talpa occidentalis]